MIKRVSASQLVAGTPAKSMSNNYPKWSDILVNLSVKDTPKVTRKLKLVGDPYEFTEFVDKQYVPNPNNDPALRGKTVRVPFPDADVNKSFNRIGHDDPSQCPWKKMGYISTTQYAQNCFERQEDGTWVVKILKKGKSIFREIAKEQIDRYNNDDLDDEDPKHFGTRNSPCVRITAEATGLEGPKSVEYKVSYDPKSTYVSDEMIEMLRKCGEPSAEDLADQRAEYIKDAKNDPYMPEWEDFFTYGYPLDKMFKHTPIKTNSVETVTVAKKTVVVQEEEIEPDLPPVVVPKSKPVVVAEDDEEDGEEEVVVAKPSKSAKKPVQKVVDEEEDDEETMGWM